MSHADYVAAHNAYSATADGAAYTADVWSTFDTDRAGIAKHTPTLTMADGVASISVRHGSAEGHWIEAIYALDETGALCGMCQYAEPDSSGDNDVDADGSVCSFTSACTGTTITAYEYCNKHGLWVGSDVAVADWANWDAYLVAHNGWETDVDGTMEPTYVANTPSSFDTDRTPIAKHTPVVSMAGGVATITVGHGSTDDHWIEAVGYFDQNGEIYVEYFPEPDDSGDYDNDAQVAMLTPPAHVTTVLPFESCNKHGIWQGQAASVAHWELVEEYASIMKTLTAGASTGSAAGAELTIANTDTGAGVHVDVASSETAYVEAIWAYDQNGELYGPQLFDGNTGETSLAEFAAPEHVAELTPYFFFSGVSDFAAQGISVGTATAFPVNEDPCAPCVEASPCFVGAEFQVALAGPCAAACPCAPCYGASEDACNAIVNPVVTDPPSTEGPTEEPNEGPTEEPDEGATEAPTAAPTEVPEPSSTSKMSATFGLLVAMASVAIMR